MNLVVLQSLIGAGLLGASVWWYRRSLGRESENAGCVLWIVWIVFGILSLLVLAWVDPLTDVHFTAIVLAGAVIWVLCGIGTVLGSRLLVRSRPVLKGELIGLTMLCAMGSALLILMTVLVQWGSGLT